jgi:hypothetical protein
LNQLSIAEKKVLEAIIKLIDPEELEKADENGFRGFRWHHHCSGSNFISDSSLSSLYFNHSVMQLFGHRQNT